jgi:hypothetical protein
MSIEEILKKINESNGDLSKADLETKLHSICLGFTRGMIKPDHEAAIIMLTKIIASEEKEIGSACTQLLGFLYTINHTFNIDLNKMLATLPYLFKNGVYRDVLTEKLKKQTNEFGIKMGFKNEKQ